MALPATNTRTRTRTSNAAGAIDIGCKPDRRLSRARAIGLLTAASAAIALAGCTGNPSKSYDISPIFPVSAGKCAKYDGRTEGSGLAAHCWVTKSKCLEATADWRQAMRQGGVTDAIEFRC